MSTDRAAPDPAADDDPNLVLRPADPDEGPVLAELHVAARRVAEPAMPPMVHTAAQTRAWFARMLGQRQREVWVAERRGEVVGYLALDDAWLESLYVRPGLTGTGIGSVLLDLAKGLRPGGFCLWVFQSNRGAQRFYRRHGLVEVERTDGADNEERAPDIRMAWTPDRTP